jgi:N-terminal acetyltransferase B complex non-catalytic subunit
LIELIARKLRQVDSSIPYNKDDSNDNYNDDDNDNNVDNMARSELDALVLSLLGEICTYGTKFSPVASCCFADLRPYIHLLVQRRRTVEINIDDIPADVLQLLSWAKEIWIANSQINTTATVTTTTTTELSLQERRKQLRKYIFAVQVVYEISNELFEDKQFSIQLLRMYAPEMSDMVNEWRTSLTYLPIVCARDGGQKEVLPGDEIVLLASQYLLFEGDLMSSSLEVLSSSSAASFPFFLEAASLLEEAIDHSPYNPHLKIAAISAYARLGATDRALCIYDDLDIKQIQLDSCSYIILPLLIKGGMYTSAIKLAALILRLHSTTSKDIKSYSSDALGNGLMFKTNEMVTFQREKMRPSLQLLQAKAVLMDTAPLMIPSELEKKLEMNGTTTGGGGLKHSGGGTTKLLPPSLVGLSSEKGFCGNDTNDLIRAEQLVIDAESYFNAPSIIHYAAQTSTIDDVVSSDNRDLTIYYYESLYRTSHSTERDMIINSLRSGHVQGLLVRAIMAVGCASAPKKGKVPKSTNERSYRCQSLHYAVSRATEFGQDAFLYDDINRSLWDACCQLCNAIIVTINGDGRVVDTLAEREVVATSYIESTMQMITSARTALSSCYSTVGIDRGEHSLLMSARVCQLLPEYVVPLYVFIETTARLFALFGWGKRKRRTKSSSGALASAALSLQDLISDMLLVMNQYRLSIGAGGDDIVAYTEMMVGSGSELLRVEAMHRVIKDIALSREKTKDRVDSFLMQMKNSLDSFKDE